MPSGKFWAALSCGLADERRWLLPEEPPRLLRYVWRDGSDVESLVTFELERTSTGGTNLRVVHTGVAESANAPVCMLKAA